ncbi:hypothetical protein [Undibacterium curvum]|uniref:hypothetical protein n=1 Tax=Undibacterium curvum TaxID=2762294 RepID=UPI003D0E6063
MKKSGFQSLSNSPTQRSTSVEQRHEPVAESSQRALVVYNPNLPHNHLSGMQQAREAQAARVQEARTLSKMGGVDIKARAAALTGHVDTLAKERVELSKWNLNAEGRNQGLVHIIDYGFAPPPKTQNRQLSQVMAHKSMSGRQLREHFGMSTEDFTAFASKEGLVASDTRLSKKMSDASSAMDAQMKSTISQSTNKKATALSSEYKAMAITKRRFEEGARDRQFFTLPVDESKKGRIKLVEKSAGLADHESFKSKHQSEIIGVTQELDRLSREPSTVATSTPSKGGTFQSTGWAKTGEKTAGGVAKWAIRTQQLPNTAESTSLKTTSNGSDLRVEKWGPSSATQKYSTVMGAPKEKK